MTQRPHFLTGAGRIVGGKGVLTGSTHDHEGNPFTRADNVTPRTEFFTRIAFPKFDGTGAPHPETEALRAYLIQAAKEDFPALFKANPNPKFSWKMHDGDVPKLDDAGQPRPLREGYAGHWIVDFKQPTRPPVVVDEDKNPITDQAELPNGFWVRVSLTAKTNGRTGNTAGIFVTHHIVQRLWHGPELAMFGPDVATALSAPVGAMPVGASATPIAPAAGLGAPPAAVPVAAPPAATQQPVTAMPGFGAPPAVAPAPPAVAPAPPAPAPPPAAAPAPPAGPQMTAAATNTYAEYKEAGWDDGALVRAGLIVG